MQTYEQSSITGTVTLTSTQLGYDPAAYTHHMITVSGLATPASDKFNVEGRIAGTSTYGYFEGAYALSDGVLKLYADYKVDAFRITFSASPTAATLTIGSLTRKSSIEV